MGIIRVAVIAVLASASALVLHQPATGQATVTIDFEDAEAGRAGSAGGLPITDEYEDKLVIFERPVTPLVIDATTIPARDGFARSGSVFVTTCYSAEFCSNQIGIELLEPHALVRMWVGYRRPALPISAGVILEAFDQAGEQIDADEVVLGPSSDLIDIRIPIEVESPAGLIARVVLRWADPELELAGLAMDDLELMQLVPEPAIVGAPDPVEIDGRSGPASEPVEFLNTGNVPLAIGDVVIEPATQGFELVSETCRGVLEPGDACDVVILFGSDEPGPFDASLILLDRAREEVTRVAMGATGPEAAQDETPTPEDTSTATPTETPGNGNGGDERVDNWLWWVGVGLIALLALATAALLRRRFRRPPADPRVDVRARPDEGMQRVVESGTPVVTLRTSLRLGDGTTTIIEDGRET